MLTVNYGTFKSQFKGLRFDARADHKLCCRRRMDLDNCYCCSSTLWCKKIPELAKTFGKAKGEYEKGRIEGDKELEEFKEKKKSQEPHGRHQ